MEPQVNPKIEVAKAIAAAFAFLLFATFVAMTTPVGTTIPLSSLVLVGIVGISLIFWMQNRRSALGFRRVIVPKSEHPWDHASTSSRRRRRRRRRRTDHLQPTGKTEELK